MKTEYAMGRVIFAFSEETWLWLDRFGILLGNSLMLLSVLGSVVAFVRRDSIRRWLRRPRFKNVGSTVDRNNLQFDAIVFIVSNEELPLWVMKRLTPRAIALVPTQESMSNAKRIEQKARRDGIRVEKIAAADAADNPEEARSSTADAIRVLQEKGYESIAVDITGGTKPMSLGAFMAAEESALTSVYVAAPFDKSLKRSNLAKANFRIVSQSESP